MQDFFLYSYFFLIVHDYVYVCTELIKTMTANIVVLTQNTI